MSRNSEIDSVMGMKVIGFLASKKSGAAAVVAAGVFLFLSTGYRFFMAFNLALMSNLPSSIRVTECCMRFVICSVLESRNA